MTPPLLEIRNVTRRFGDFTAVDNVSLTINTGEFFTLLGPSGCGKTTTLKMINRIIPPTSGRVLIDGQDTADLDEVTLRRHIGYVIQQIGLFPNMTIEENIMVVPRLLGWDKARCKEKARELMSMVKLEPKQYLQRYPRELSGGQQQRVALARALAPEPLLLLLDEPFSNLDVELRRSLSQEVREILKARGTSAILVTHDQEEAFAVCDHIGVFKEGHLEQWDTPYNLYHEPLTPFVASFVGQGYFIRGQLLSPDTVQTELGVIRGNRAYSLPSGSAVDVLLRPDDLVHAPQGELKARIVGKTFLGAATLYRLQLPTGTQLESIFPSHADHQPGDDVGIRVAADHLVVFAARGSVAAHLAPVQA